MAAFTFDVIGAAESCTNMGELDAVIGPAFEQLGASVYEGVEARVTAEGPDVQLRFGRSPEGWEAHYRASGHAAHDPVVRHMLTSADPLYWSEFVRRDPPLSPRERRVFDEARAFGFTEGMVAPLHHPGGAVSAVVLMGDALDARDPAQRQTTLILSHAFGRIARRLQMADRSTLEEQPRLTRREAEALYWVGQGASDKRVAIAMALSPHTVAGYLRSAQVKLGAVGRVAVAKLAAERGLLPGYLPPPGKRQENGVERPGRAGGAGGLA